MKHTFLLLVLIPAFFLYRTLDTVAQTRYIGAGATLKFSIGAGVAPGISLPIGTLDKEDDSALGFALRGGLNVRYPFSTEMAVFLNTGIDIRNPGVKEDSLLDPRFYNVSYFYIQPGIWYSSLGLSLNIGIPMSGSEPVPRDSGVRVDDTRDIASDMYELLLEPRLNGTLILMDEESYWLGLDISVGLPLNTLYKEEFQRTEEENGRTLVPSTSPFSAHLGLTFQFGLFNAF